MRIEIVNQRRAQLNRVMERPDDYRLPLGQQLVEKREVIEQEGFYQQSEQCNVDGVQLCFYNRTHAEQFETQVKSDRPYMQFRFEISGGTTRYQPHFKSGDSIVTSTGQSALFYLPELDGKLLDGACVQSNSLEVELAPRWLTQHLTADCRVSERFLTAIEQQQPAVLGGKSLYTTPAMHQMIHELRHCPYTGQVKRLFVEGKLLLLLALQVEQAKGMTAVVQPLRLTLKERDSLFMLRESLTSQFYKRDTLEDFARLTAMNRTKMQAGFKQLFGTSIHDFLMEIRLSEAHQLLSSSSADALSIATLARQLGYKQYNHFSTAFKKRYGCAPSRLLKA